MTRRLLRNLARLVTAAGLLLLSWGLILEFVRLAPAWALAGAGLLVLGSAVNLVVE